MVMLSKTDNLLEHFFYILLLIFTITIAFPHASDSLTFLLLCIWAIIFFTKEKNFTVSKTTENNNLLNLSKEEKLLFTSVIVLFIFFSLSLIINYDTYISPKKVVSAIKTIVGFLAPFLVYFMVGSLQINQKKIEQLLNITWISMTVIILFYLIIDNPFNNPHFNIFNLHHNITGGIIALIFMILLNSVYFENNRIMLKLKYLSLLIFSLGIIFTLSRSTWLGIIPGVFWIIYSNNKIIKPKKKYFSLIITILLVIIVIISIIINPIIIDRFKSIVSTNNFSNLGRLTFWKTAINIIKDAPIFAIGPNKLFGIGTDNFREFFKILRPDYIENVESLVPHAHNNFIQILAEQGFLGLICFVFLIFSLFNYAFKLRKFNEFYNYSNILISTLIIFFVTGLMDYTWRFESMVFLIMLLFGLVKALKNNKLIIGA